jgi:hypothetical protein
LLCRQRNARSKVLIAVLGLAACGGDGFTPTQPVLGHIAYEWQGPVPAGGVDLTLGFPGPRLVVPPNAVPPGTTLTFRLTSPITKSAPSGWPLPPFGGEVVQILPEGLTFAQPILDMGGGAVPATQTSVPIDHLFRAADDDAAWTWSSSIDSAPIDTTSPVAWPIDRSGLWTQGMAPPSALVGTYRLLGAMCKVGVMATPPGIYLTLTADRYSLTAAEPACHDEGPFTAAPFTLTTGARTLGFDALVKGTAIRLKTSGDLVGICGAASVGSIVLYLDYAGCATDADCGAGGSCDGQLCGPAPTTATASCLADVMGNGGGGK